MNWMILVQKTFTTYVLLLMVAGLFGFAKVITRGTIFALSPYHKSLMIITSIGLMLW